MFIPPNIVNDDLSPSPYAIVKAWYMVYWSSHHYRKILYILYIYVYIYIYVCNMYIYIIWMNYNDVTVKSLEWWLGFGESSPKCAYFIYFLVGELLSFSQIYVIFLFISIWKESTIYNGYTHLCWWIDGQGPRPSLSQVGLWVVRFAVTLVWS